MNKLLVRVQNQRKLDQITNLSDKVNASVSLGNKVKKDGRSKFVRLSIQQMLQTLYRRLVEEVGSTFSVREMKFYLANLF